MNLKQNVAGLHQQLATLEKAHFDLSAQKPASQEAVQTPTTLRPVPKMSLMEKWHGVDRKYNVFPTNLSLLFEFQTECYPSDRTRIVCTVFVDSGAAGNFIDQDYAAQLGVDHKVLSQSPAGAWRSFLAHTVTWWRYLASIGLFSCHLTGPTISPLTSSPARYHHVGIRSLYWQERRRPWRSICLRGFDRGPSGLDPHGHGVFLCKKKDRISILVSAIGHSTRSPPRTATNFSRIESHSGAVLGRGLQAVGHQDGSGGMASLAPWRQ